MSTTSKASAAAGPTRQTVRQLVTRLANHQSAQRRGAQAMSSTWSNSRAGDATSKLNTETLTELRACRDRAVSLLIHPTHTPQATGAATQETATGSPAATHGTSSATPGCFSQVIPEENLRTVESDVDSTLCGLTAAVSDILRVQEFTSSEPTVLRQLSGHKELPLVSWLRRHSALIVAEVASETPFSIGEGSCFGPDERNAKAVRSGACHYAFSASLLGPPALSSCVGDDVVGFKPTAQTFGTFTDDYKLPISAMTVGITAGTVDDMLYLWQQYTASIDNDVLDAATPNVVSNTHTTAAALNGEDSAAGGDAKEVSTDTPDAAQPLSGTTDSSTAARHESASAESPTATPKVDDRALPKRHTYAHPDILDHSPSNYTIQPDAEEAVGPGGAGKGDGGARRGVSSSSQPQPVVQQQGTKPSSDEVSVRSEAAVLYPVGHTRWSPKRHQASRLADIDVGWRDYNASAMRESYRRAPSSPGWWRHVLLGGLQSSSEGSQSTWLSRALSSLRPSDTAGKGGSAAPLVELTVGYPSEWLDGPCRSRYGGAEAFRAQLARMVYTRSTLHKDRKMEIIPLAMDLDLEETWEAVQVIAKYETARAFERLLPSQLAQMGSQQHGDALMAATLSHNLAATVREHAAASATSAPVSSSPSATPSADPTTGSAEATEAATAAAAPASSPASPSAPSSPLALLTNVLQELPPDVLRLLDEGQKVSLYAYHRALRTRDEVVRVTEDHFQDVDMLVVPLLSEPYMSGDLRSILPVLPFHLAGNPMVGLQLTENMPVALVEQPGRDGALLEDAYRFVQMVRGNTPRWWQSGGMNTP